MVRCKTCGTEVSSTARFCSSCGATLPSADVATIISDETALSLEDQPVPKTPSGATAAKSARTGIKSSHSASSSALLNAGRFLPGSLLAETLYALWLFLDEAAWVRCIALMTSRWASR